MTSNQITQLKAGRQLDALVADIVMGWSVCACGSGSFYGGCGLNYSPGSNEEADIPLYSSETDSAMLVMEEMRYDMGYAPVLADLVCSESSLDNFLVLVCKAALLTRLGMTIR